MASRGNGLKKGSFILEATVSVGTTEPLTLLEYSGLTDWGLRFSVKLDPKGKTSLEIIRGRDKQYFGVDTGASPRERNLRITYAWDINTTGVLTLEDIADGFLSQGEFDHPPAVPHLVIERLTRMFHGTRAFSGTEFFGFSDQIEPVGLPASIAEKSPVETPRGPVAIENLKTGDLVMTRDSGPQPIRWIGSRIAPAKGGFRPVRLCAPYFGLSCDILVAPEQRLMVGGAQVEYLFGEEELLVEARHLINGNSAYGEMGLSSIRYYQLLLDRHEVINVGGADLESLYAGTIRNDPDLLRTTLLCEMPAMSLPTHSTIARPLLKDFEAVTLRSVMSA